MSTPLPFLCATDAAHVVAVRRVMGDIGLGYGGIPVPLVAVDDETATPESEPTGYFTYDQSANSDLVATLQALVGGDVPGLDINGNPVMWGVGDISTQAEAIAAFASPNVAIISAVGVDVDLLDGWVAATLASLGYKKRPDAT